MNTLLLSPELFLHEGGIARIMRLYLKALCEIAGPAGRVDSLVLNDRPETDPRLMRYCTDRLGEHLGCNRQKLAFVRHTLRLARRADVVVCAHLHQLPIVWLAQRLRPALKYHLVAHGIEVWRPYTWLERRALLGADGILCVSEYTRRQMLRFCPALRPDRLVVVPNTLDPHFAPELNDQLSNAPFAIPRILTVGRLSSSDTYKGFDTLIEAMPAIRREYPAARLRIVGKGDDLPRLQALAAELGVAGSVDFLGPISDEALRAEYAACDLFALPSRKEGFGLVYLEAMVYGKPCIGARAGGAPEVITPDTGVLVTYGNIPELATAVDELVRHHRDSEVVRRHADTFAFPAFTRRLAAALA
ncbi:GDP-mannose-dependent alpha-(1-6)-phosphatidylinositol monomannoside mannosyltransferase [Lacunisphaera limnophila]|uniref:GDP-mannose-dependent alpha-(1-6)-phosphatidylinositol monomannoside mannosyltransferase n=1 Tax=Lacunisphaera limnophila TaxID=1838286 RepID=A0A1D8AXZ8_9BACT|nr:glycosyltransferase family 4 protein [Lacunisphaera limnophila]AOS45755.1 GDP-mannose-dependent alpha-(1-6)-phosphatidylinositol monomannoside mannosyltransferase [Lacunisphaera limnophila]